MPPAEPIIRLEGITKEYRMGPRASLAPSRGVDLAIGCQRTGGGDGPVRLGEVDA